MTQISNVITVATVFIGLWTLKFMLDSQRRGFISETIIPMQELQPKVQGEACVRGGGGVIAGFYGICICQLYRGYSVKIQLNIKALIPITACIPKTTDSTTVIPSRKQGTFFIERTVNSHSATINFTDLLCKSHNTYSSQSSSTSRHTFTHSPNHLTVLIRCINVIMSFEFLLAVTYIPNVIESGAVYKIAVILRGLIFAYGYK